MRSKINWPFLLKLSAVVFVALVAVHFLHHRQVGRQAGAFLHQADVARDATPPDPEREIAYLKRYLMARPTETDVRERLGRLMCKHAKSGRDITEAYLVVQDTLGRDPTRDELRRFAIDFAMEPRVGMHAEALTDIEILRKKRPDDGELEGLEARCWVQAKKYEKANEWYELAVKHRPDLVETYPGWAGVLRLELKRGEDADKAVAQMLAKNPGNFRAHLLVAEYWRTFWGLGQNATVAAKTVAEAQHLKPDEKVSAAIAKAVEEAKKLAPDELDVILAVADVARFRGYEFARAAKPEQAKTAFADSYRILKAGLAKYPKAASIYLALAALEAEQRQEKEPVAVIKDGLAAIPDSDALLIALLDYQIRAGDATGGTETLDRLKGRGLPPVQVEFQQGRLLMLKEEWLDAALTLEHVREQATTDRPLSQRVNLFLGRCYEQLGLLDRRLEAFNRSVPLDMTDPLWVPAMQGVAEAEAALGKVDAALEAYTKLKDRNGGAWVPIARLRMILALQTPPEKKPDWTKAEEAMGFAEKVLPDEPEVRILRASLLNYSPAPGNPAEAHKRLEALKAERPKDITVWIALAGQDQRDGGPERALATLAAAEKEAGDSPALRLARAALWVAKPEPDLPQKLEGLAANVDTFTPAQRRALLRKLAEIASVIAPESLGTRLWDRLAALQPYDLGVHLIRFDLALRAGDEAKIDAVMAQIRHIDGESGAQARFARAAFLIWRAQKKNDSTGLTDLNEAAALLAKVETQRPGWGRVAFAQALVLDRQGDRSAALVKYQQALAEGETNPEMLRRLLELLRAANRFDDAVALLQKLPKATDADADVQRLAADVLWIKQPAEAVKRAERYASNKSTEMKPADHIWLGQMYFGAGDRAKAEAAFRQAVASGPDAPDGWLVLIQFLAETNRLDDAKKELEEAKGRVAEPERGLFYALGLRLVGKLTEATKAFEQARTKPPTDPRILRRILRAEAQFLFETGQLTEARDAFKRVIELPSATDEEKNSARWGFAVCLASDRDYATSRQALAELGLMEGDRSRAPTENASPGERRARALVLALQRDQASRLEAIGLLKAERELAPNDQFMLAQLYRGVGKWGECRTTMTGLLRENNRTPLYLIYYAGWLLQAGDHRAAAEWVTQLTKLQPDALSTAELRARLAAAQGNRTAAHDILVARADAPDAPVLAIAQVCESIKLDADAEKLFQRAVAGVKEKRPQAPLVLAAFYGRHGRTAEALQVCDEVRKTVPPQVVGPVAVAALYDNPAPKDADVVGVATWLEEAAKKATGETAANLFQLLASVRNLQGNYAESMRLYRDAVSANARDVLALNNLAFLVSTREEKHDEALSLIERAKKVRGPLPVLLDTEALIRLNKNEGEAARRLLETVIAEAPSGSAYFHLARAELALEHKLEARRAWQQATELGVKRTDLHPLERAEFERLSGLLK